MDSAGLQSLCTSSRDLLNRLPDPLQHGLLLQHLERFKQWWRGGAAGDGDADWCEHLPCFHTELFCSLAERLVEGLMIEVRLRQHLAGTLKDLARHSGVALL